MKEGPSSFEATDGLLLVRGAREAIENYLRTRQVRISESLQSPKFGQKLGCFVSLKEADHSLRGCIGFPEPIYQLREAVSRAAVSAATEDPRFPSINPDELISLLVEVSVLTKPVEIQVRSQEELPSKIVAGVDGLILKWSFGSGLLLPQVATEYGWDSIRFLENLSLKAGAAPDQWKTPGTNVYKFQASVFGEQSPIGDVVILEDDASSKGK